MDTWICATIDSIIDDWWYLSCVRCSCSMENDKGIYTCRKCSHTRGTFRYRIQFGVSDASSSATLICWDKDCQNIVGKSCDILKREYDQKRKDIFELPDELDELTGKTYLFKVRIKPDDPFSQSSTFSVIKVVVDEHLVSKYSQWVVQYDESDFLTLLQREETASGLDPALEDEASTPLKKMQDKNVAGDNAIAKRNLSDQFAAESVTSNKGKAKVDNDGNLLEDKNE
ncbi:Unknown protein [Striga hermonthica]|uniref:Replication factor A C-terminal domain-containing protein n=1 Tax=Striga hermonthica TaxID=68872 RepID=A0A9N7MWA6_STRHE|nr:Unknown protein [Striga hermonthica]